MKSAIETGYKRSRAAIRDGNFSTLIIAALLFILGINMFKGFGLMMMLNTVLILALNVPLTRDLLLMAFHKKADYMKKSELDKKLK
jgi:preprotein translocase subunit SecD